MSKQVIKWIIAVVVITLSLGILATYLSCRDSRKAKLANATGDVLRKQSDTILNKADQIAKTIIPLDTKVQAEVAHRAVLRKQVKIVPTVASNSTESNPGMETVSIPSDLLTTDDTTITDETAEITELKGENGAREAGEKVLQEADTAHETAYTDQKHASNWGVIKYTIGGVTVGASAVILIKAFHK